LGADLNFVRRQRMSFSSAIQQEIAFLQRNGIASDLD
jgi:hypothetical protein